MDSFSLGVESDQHVEGDERRVVSALTAAEVWLRSLRPRVVHCLYTASPHQTKAVSPHLTTMNEWRQDLKEDKSRVCVDQIIG